MCQHVLANMGDSASKALKEYEQILTVDREKWVEI
jgi:hypothetical protein